MNGRSPLYPLCGWSDAQRLPYSYGSIARADYYLTTNFLGISRARETMAADAFFNAFCIRRLVDHRPEAFTGLLP
jgi:hypothetical protein